MARSRNPAESVAALPAVLGIRTAEVLTTKILITCGLRVLLPVNVSSMQCRHILAQTKQ